MSEDFPAFLHAPSHYELVYVGPSGTMTQCFGHQPTTVDIAQFRGKQHRFCIQLVGDIYEVYDLATITFLKRINTTTIGIPVFTHEDPDAAIMWAVLNV